MTNSQPSREFKAPGIPEGIRRALASVFQWGGWLGCTGIYFWATNTYNPNEGKFAPQWVGFTFIFLIGVAIAGTTARSRMRNTDTIISALQAGMRVSENRWRQLMERESNQIDGKTLEVQHKESDLQ